MRIEVHFRLASAISFWVPSVGFVSMNLHYLLHSEEYDVYSPEKDVRAESSAIAAITILGDADQTIW